MDEEELIMSMPEIPQVQISGALIALAREADRHVAGSETRKHLLAAMDALVYQINPKRGEVVEVKRK